MNPTLTTLLLGLSATGAVFFLLRGIQMRAGLRGLSQLEIKRAELEEARAKAEKVPAKERLRVELRRHGYEGDLFPFTAAMGFLYLLLMVLLHLTGLSYSIGALIALPASAATVWAASAWAAQARRRRFNHQLVDLLELVAGQIEGGNGAQKALSNVVGNMPEPIRGEMIRVLDAQMLSKDLIAAMRELAERYPSRAMSMFISALEIDRAEGHAIGPALHQAAELLKRDFSLAAEANAEISQTRGEFFAVVGIIGGIAAQLLFGSDPTAREAYTSLIGLTVVGLATANLGFGVFRFVRLLNVIRGDT